MRWRSQNKFGARKCVVDGIEFDSAREAKRYRELALLLAVGEISDLNRQVKFDLLPAQHDSRGKVVERGVSYVADFTYFDKKGEWIVEDAKGMRTRDYVLKRKMMLYFHGIRIVEV